MQSRKVVTVLGEVDAADLGITLAHEHFFIDLSCLWHEPACKLRKHLVNAPVAAGIRGELLFDPYNCKDNLVLDDLPTAAIELNRFRALGGGAAVDLSSSSIGPFPEKLAELSKLTGVHIIAGTGFYTKAAHPEKLANMSEEEVAEEIIGELDCSFKGSNVRAGVIGELGTSSPLFEDERKVLRAAAKAANHTGAGINVHLAIFHQEANHVLDVLEKAGADLRRVALSHLDEFPDTKHHLSLAQRGCFLEFDCFGSEVYFEEDGLREPTDAERIEALLKLIEAGYLSQILLSQDVCTKMQLRKYGGLGYDHILRTIVPRLKRLGVSDSELKMLLVENPARFLALSK